jgi:glycosyltransferase involved in cell wall biosynthesis
MKLAFVSIFDPSDIHAWSGLGVYILSALQQAGLQIETIGDLSYELGFIYKAKEILYPRLSGKTYKMLWDPILLKRFASQVEQRLVNSDCHTVFSIWSNPIAYLRTDKPIIFWGDATFAGLKGFYPNYTNLCAETIRGGHRAEQLALSKSVLAIYSSQWAAYSAIHDYGADPGKVKVVPFGANIDCSRTLDDIRIILQQKDHQVCKLIFVGKEWERKGGALAVEVANRLNQRGLPTELHLVGCQPPGKLPTFVKSHGFISKTSASGRKLLDELFSQAHFFILPALADCTPVVFPEAASFGLPVLTSHVGGIPSVIRESQNGFTFPLEAGAEAYCAAIQRLWASRSEYEQLALSSFQEYAERLNWASAGQDIKQLIEQYCG